MKAIEILLKQFESFVKRALMPSVSFVFVFLVVGLISLNTNNFKLIPLNINIESINITGDVWWILLILLIGLSFLLSILNQVIYDNCLKGNFHILFSDTDDSLLKKYRDLVIQKVEKEAPDIYNSLEKNDFTDNNLYQIIGRKLSYYEKATSTSRYVDDSKSIGIFFISLILSILFWCFIFDNSNIGVFLSLLIGFIGYEIIKAKYRSRAVRIYVNYLLGEDNKSNDFKILNKRFIERKNC